MKMEAKRVNLSLPSLRVDSFSMELMEKGSKGKKKWIDILPLKQDSQKA